MTSIAPHSPSTILLKAVPLWEQPGGLPPALEKPFFAPALREAIPRSSPRLDRGGSANVRAAIILLKSIVSRSAQHSTTNHQSILFPDTF